MYIYINCGMVVVFYGRERQFDPTEKVMLLRKEPGNV